MNYNKQSIFHRRLYILFIFFLCKIWWIIFLLFVHKFGRNLINKTKRILVRINHWKCKKINWDTSRLTMGCTWGTWVGGKWWRAIWEWVQSCSDPCCSSSRCKWYNQQRMLKRLSPSQQSLSKVLQIAWSRICARRMDESQLRCRFPERKCQIITLTVYHHHVLLIVMENGMLKIFLPLL